MQGRPTGVVAASKDAALAREVQELFASPCMRVNTSTDVTGAHEDSMLHGRAAGCSSCCSL
jgi:glycerol-3-phosphate dehydrogenase